MQMSRMQHKTRPKPSAMLLAVRLLFLPSICATAISLAMPIKTHNSLRTSI